MRCLQPAKTDKAGCCNPESERCSSQPGKSLNFNIMEASWLSKLSKLVVQVGFSNKPSCSSWFFKLTKLLKLTKLTCVRIWVPPPQEAEQEAQALHSRPKNKKKEKLKRKNILYQMGKSYRCKTGTAS